MVIFILTSPKSNKSLCVGDSGVMLRLSRKVALLCSCSCVEAECRAFSEAFRLLLLSRYSFSPDLSLLFWVHTWSVNHQLISQPFLRECGLSGHFRRTCPFPPSLLLFSSCPFLSSSSFSSPYPIPNKCLLPKFFLSVVFFCCLFNEQLIKLLIRQHPEQLEFK